MRDRLKIGFTVETLSEEPIINKRCKNQQLEVKIHSMKSPPHRSLNSYVQQTIQVTLTGKNIRKLGYLAP